MSEVASGDESDRLIILGIPQLASNLSPSLNQSGERRRREKRGDKKRKSLTVFPNKENDLLLDTIK